MHKVSIFYSYRTLLLILTISWESFILQSLPQVYPFKNKFCNRVIFTITNYLEIMCSRSDVDSHLCYFSFMLIPHYITELPYCGNSTDFKAIVSKISNNTPMSQTHTMSCHNLGKRNQIVTIELLVFYWSGTVFTITKKPKWVLEKNKAGGGGKARMVKHGGMSRERN